MRKSGNASNDNTEFLKQLKKKCGFNFTASLIEGRFEGGFHLGRCENGANADLNTFEFTEKFEIELSAHTEKILNHFRFLFEAIREIAPKQI